MRTLLAWTLSSWRPELLFSRETLRELWGYSGKLLYASMFHRVVSNVHTVIIGKVFAPEALGLFTRAQSLQNLPVSLLTGMTQRVAFPAFSRLQDDAAALRDSVRAMVSLLACVMALLMALLSLVSRDLVVWLLGPNWTGAGPLLEVVAGAGVLASLFPILSQATMALGRSSDFLRAEVLKKIAVLLILVVALRFGLIGFAYGLVVISISDYILSARPVRNAISYQWWQQACDIIPWAVLGFGLAAAVRGLELDPGRGTFVKMVAQSTLFAVAYLGIAIAWRRRALRGAVQLLMGK